ncbi:MAG: hypothetical protein NDJ89_10080 [Oligoflexia bacterium]|nr:hypothetical protein [Oligoflexia bacterium]
MWNGCLEVLCQLLVSGAGVAVLPERVIMAIREEEIEALPGSPSVVDRICVVFRREFVGNIRGKAFVRAVFASSR